jgi:hypothetical protein
MPDKTRGFGLRDCHPNTRGTTHPPGTAAVFLRLDATAFSAKEDMQQKVEAACGSSLNEALNG